MGFDLYGIKEAPEVDWKDEESTKKYFEWQETTEGAYFRNNVWWWRPLWHYVCEICKDILDEQDIILGSTNDGHEITEEKAIKIGNKLNEEIESGRCEQYKVDYDLRIKTLPLDNCTLCNGTGCNACNGKGKTENWLASYPFSVDNVKNFTAFCMHSGGFTIC